MTVGAPYNDAPTVYSLNQTGKRAWESNPPTRLVTPFARFEDEDSHRTTCALTNIVPLCRPYRRHIACPRHQHHADVYYDNRAGLGKFTR